MRIHVSEGVDTDVLVIGGGGAGLRAAVAAAETGARVHVISDARVGYGCLTAVSGGAFASTRASDWQGHFRDTVVGGRFLGDQDLQLKLTQSIDDEATRLAGYGALYLSPKTAPWLNHVIDPGHRAAQMIYGRHAIGTDITVALRCRAEALGITLLEGVMATELVVEEDQVLGAHVVTREGNLHAIAARATVLATGGMGQAYARTDNTPGATGDGYCLAYSVGLPLRDMEFMQFYPLAQGSGTPGIYYEILVSGVEGQLLNSNGDDIRQLHGLPDPHSTTRDYLSIAIMKEVAAGRGIDGGVVLDISSIPDAILEVLRPILPKAALRGHRRFSVAPTAHTHLGGVVVDSNMSTGLKGLYAAGEVTGGVHGANRLGGNALSETLVYGGVAGHSAAEYAASTSLTPVPPDRTDAERKHLDTLSRGSTSDYKAIRLELRQLMWKDAGVLRSEESLQRALGAISGLRRRLKSVGADDGRGLQHLLKTRSLLLSSELLCRSALTRTESRGAQSRTDYPEEDDDWLCTVVIRKGPEGPSVSTRPVSFPHIQP